jgi:cellulose synthase/poly-beta-1,6-N-acetylglucosamine synthase-like glycosyltransferase
VLGTGAAAASLPGSVELFLLSCAALIPERRTSTGRVGGGNLWRVAVIIPAHNEEVNIASCVQSLLATERDDMDVDIYVIADNCSDRTADLADGAGAHVLLRTDDVQRGKGYALHFAFNQLERLEHDCVLIVDADTKVATNFVVAAAGAMREGADAIQVQYLVRNTDSSTKTRLRELGLRAFNVTRLLGRERLGISVGLLGNGFGLRRETLRAVPYLAASVVEDLEYHLLLVAHGLRVRFVEGTAVFGEVPVHTAGMKTQRARWEGGRLRIMMRATPELVGWIFKGRIRFFEPLLELLLLPLAFHVLLLCVAISTPWPVARIVGVSGIAIVLLHLVATIIVSGGSWNDLAALVRAPLYIAWKVLLVPSLIRNARSTSLWVRTKRNAEK